MLIVGGTTMPESRLSAAGSRRLNAPIPGICATARAGISDTSPPATIAHLHLVSISIQYLRIGSRVPVDSPKLLGFSAEWPSSRSRQMKLEPLLQPHPNQPP